MPRFQRLDWLIAAIFATKTRRREDCEEEQNVIVVFVLVFASSWWDFFVGSASLNARHRDHEPCASFRPVFRTDAAAMELDQVPHDRQAESGAAGIARARFVDAVE